MLRKGLKFLLAVGAIAGVGAVAAGAGLGPSFQRFSAGEPPSPPGQVDVIQSTQGHYAGDVRKLPPGQVKKGEARPEPQVPNEAPGKADTDTAVQTAAVAAAAPAPAASNSFDGLDYATAGAGWPPDTNGDVGPNHYVQTVNTSIGIYAKTGSQLAQFTFDQLFSAGGTGTPCDNSNQGDPVVVYDPIGDRWVISDFAWNDAQFSTGPFYECFAVSKTADPVAGGWWFYAFKVENTSLIPDYPKLGVWPDAIYMSANVFATTGSQAFKNAQVWAFDRVKMEAGLPATAVTFNVANRVQGVSVFSLQPSNTRSVTGLPPAGAPNYFASIYGSYNVRIWKFKVNFTTPSQSSFTGPTNVPISTFSVGPSSVPELKGNTLDTLSYRLMMQNQYTNQGGRESLWLTHTVGSGGTPNIARVRWYEVPVTGGTIAKSPRQQSTFAPDARNRFIPSLAVDKQGNMAIGYSVSDSTMYPSIRYAGRLAGDPLSTLGQTETSLIEGTGFQCCTFSDGSVNHRWGDYSAMTIDPDGCTFWFTTEYATAQPTTNKENNWKTRIGSFKYPGCS
jgi:hypothetical protein